MAGLWHCFFPHSSYSSITIQTPWTNQPLVSLVPAPQLGMKHFDVMSSFDTCSLVGMVPLALPIKKISVEKHTDNRTAYNILSYHLTSHCLHVLSFIRRHMFQTKIASLQHHCGLASFRNAVANMSDPIVWSAFTFQARPWAWEGATMLYGDYDYSYLKLHGARIQLNAGYKL